MGGDDLELFERSLRAATEQHTGARSTPRSRSSAGTTRCRSTRAPRSRRCSSSRAKRARARRRSIGSWRSRSGASSTPTPRWCCPRSVAPTCRCEGDVVRWPRDVDARLVPRRVVDGCRRRSAPTALDDARRARHRPRPRPGRGARRGHVDRRARRSTGAAAVQLAQLALAHELIGVSRRCAVAGARARARAHPVRPADREVPGRAAPAGRDARRDRDRGRGASTPPGSIPRRSPPPWPRPRAGRGARVAAKHCQQVLAGIGFTTEHDLHRYLRRSGCSTSSSVRARSSPSASARTCSRHAELPPAAARSDAVLASLRAHIDARVTPNADVASSSRACGRGWRGRRARRTTASRWRSRRRAGRRCAACRRCSAAASSRAPTAAAAWRCAGRAPAPPRPTVPVGTTRLATPRRTASSADTRSPRRMYSFARSRLVSSGHVMAPPSPATNPSATCGSEKYACSSISTRSLRPARLQPRPDRRPVHGRDDRHFDARHPAHDDRALFHDRGAQVGVVHHAVEEVEVATTARTRGRRR